MRAFFLILGLLFTGIGIVGVFVPLLPTTDFMLLALICFGKSSKKLETWLLTHRRFGPPLTAWRSERSISKSHKILAIGLIWLSIGLSVIFILKRPWVKVLFIVIAAGVTWFLASRKTRANFSAARPVHS